MSMSDNVTSGGIRSSMVEADRYPRVPDVNNHRPPSTNGVEPIKPPIDAKDQDVIKNQDQELRHYNEKLRQSKELLRANNELRRKAEMQERTTSTEEKRTFETYDESSDKVMTTELVKIKPNENLIDLK